MRKLKILMLLILLIVPISLSACGNENMDTMTTPKGLTVESGGLITFERVKDEGYYTIMIDDLEINVFSNNSNVELYNENGKNYLQYDASKIFVLGESYTVRVCAKADGKRDSNYSKVVAYTHTIPMAKPTNIQINGTVLTWDVVENASTYFVRVLTPTDNICADDSETIAQSELTTYQFSTNRFDFSSILTNAGNYKFYINAVSNNANYTESGYSSKVVFRHEVGLSTPVNSQIFIVNELDADTSLYENNFHLIAVIDPNANGITIRLGEYQKTVELNGLETSIIQDENLLDINLNEFFMNLYVDGEPLDFNKIGQYSFQIQANYLTTNEQDKFYIDSDFSTDILVENCQELARPEVELDYNQLSDCYMVSWQVADDENISGFKVYVALDTSVEVYELNKTTRSMLLEDGFISVSVQAVGLGNFSNSEMSEYLSTHNETITDDVSIDLDGDVLNFTMVDGAHYIVEIGNQIFVLSENSLNLSNVRIGTDEISLAVIKSGYAPKIVTQTIDFSKKLETPTIGQNQGFQASDPYLLTFTGVENAIGYYIYLSAGENGEANRIQEIFTSTAIDLSKYVIKQGQYRNYYVQIQAVAPEYSGYINSDLTEYGTLSISHTRVLEVPQFLQDDSGNPTPIVRRNENGSTKYYLCFYGVEYAHKYEVMINFNTINVSSDGRTDLYEIDITNYLMSANSYTIMVRALPNPDSDENIKASQYNSTDYVLTMQLNEVTNIRITENDGRYTLSFDIQENAEAYRVRIVKLYDGGYTDYLYDLDLLNPFEVVQSTDITDYVLQAGKYYVYVTALAGKDSFYGDSNESQTYGELNKLTTLATPSEIDFFNQSEDSYLVQWVGDENADYYIVRVTDTAGVSVEYKAYNSTQYNINPSITSEGNYAVSIKAVVDSASENAIEYTSSPFSEAVYLYYTYSEPYDFLRYSIYMYGEEYDFSIANASELTYLLWYHYLFGIDSDFDLPIYIELQAEESVRDAIIRLADDATQSRIYNFGSDGTYQGMLTSSTDSALFGYVARALLSIYPEMAVMSNFEISHEDNSQIFRLYYENALDVEKIDTDQNFIEIATDYSNIYKYLDLYSRRSGSSLFAIDSLPEMNVSTTEQLVMAVQYGRKPNFVGDSEIVETVYENAKDVLRAIIHNNMTELEKVTAIFDWLEYAYNLNYHSNRILSGDSTIEGTLSDYGNRKEYYLEGIFLGLYDSNSGGFDGEFYLGNKNATSESFAKAFTLLCGIEGIESRKVNGTITYSLDSSGNKTNTVSHAWNKVYISTSSNESAKAWYALDITYSDNRFVAYSSSECYNYSSHLYFLVTDSFLNSSLRLEENELVIYPSAVTNYDYYANSSFSMSIENLYSIAPKDNLGSNITDFTYGKKFETNAQNLYQIYSMTSEYSQLQAYVMNAIMYAKYLQLDVNASNMSSFEFKVEHTAMGGGTLPINATITEILDTINTYYCNSINEYLETRVHYVVDSSNLVTTYIFTLEFI